MQLVQHEGWDLVATLEVPGHSRRYIDIHECAKDMAIHGITAFNDLLRLWEKHAFDVLIVRDGNRFARTQSLHAYVVERTIDVGARLFTFSLGWVDEHNKRMFIAMDGFKASGEVDELVAKRRSGMAKVVAAGLPASYSPCMSHRVEYDPITRKATRMTLNEDKLDLWDKLYELIMARVGWSSMEYELYRRYAIINANTGAPYARLTMHGVVYNPNFWGHTGRYYDHKDIGQTWVYDDSVPPPPGVELYRHTIPPVWTGEKAERIKSELRRRQTIMGGRAKANTTYAFTGLVQCATCGKTLSIKTTTHTYSKVGTVTYLYWRCVSARTPELPTMCSH